MAEFICNKCSGVFFTRDDLRRHIFAEHLYPKSKASSLIETTKEDPEAESEEMEKVLKSNLADLLGSTDSSSEFSEIAEEAATKGYVKTHKILKNKNRQCAMFEVAQHEPPGWKCVKSGTYKACKKYMLDVCRSVNKC